MKKVTKDNRKFIEDIQKQKCFLCKMSDSTIVFEDDDFITVLDEYPAVEGHVICAPKKHVEHLSNLSKEEAKKLMDLIHKIDAALVKIYNPFRVAIVSSGLAVKHLHFHVIPVPNEEMMWDFKYLKKDEVIEYSDKEKEDLVRQIREVVK